MSLLCLRCSKTRHNSSSSAASLMASKVLTECFSPRRQKAISRTDHATQADTDVDSIPVHFSASFASSLLSSPGIMTSPRDDDGPCDMDVTYITERIIALTFPSTGHEAVYRKSLQEVARMLHDKHEDNYQIINLCERRAEIQKYNEQVLDLGWPASLAPPLERLCAVCKSIDSWLSSDSRNVVVLHCRAGLGRLGVVIASFIHYSGICASDDQALDRFAMKKFYDDKLANQVQPSQRRYVHYFHGLLSGAIMVIPQPLFIHQISVMGIPVLDDRNTKVFFKIYQAIRPLHTTPIYTVTGVGERLTVGVVPGVQLQGDILIKCYHKSLTGGAQSLFRCQFHTSTVPDLACSFTKHQLDDCCSDARFSDNTKLELIFSRQSTPTSVLGHTVSAPVDYSGTLERWDSYEDFNKFSTVTTIDGSQSEAENPSRVRLVHVKEKILSAAQNSNNNNSLHRQDKLSSSDARKQQPVSSSSVRFASDTYDSQYSASSTSYHRSTTDSYTEQLTTPKTPLLSKFSHTSSARINFSDSVDSTSPYSLSGSSGVFSNSSVSREADSPDNASQTKSPASAMSATRSSVTSHNSHHAPANGETNPLDAIINELLHDDLYPLSNPYRAKKPVNTLTAPHHTDYKLPPSGTVTTHTGNTTTVLSWDSSQTTTTAKISSTQNTMSNRTATRASSSTTSNALGHGHGYGSGYAGSAASHSPLSHNSLAGRGQGQGPPVPPTRSSHPHSTLQRAATLNDGHVEHIKLGDAVSVEIPLGGRSSVNVHQQGQQHSPIGIRTESTMRGGRGGDTSPYATTSAPQPPPRTSHPASGTSSLQQPNNADFTSLQSKPVSASSRYEASSSSYSRGYFSDSEDPLSWLDQQRSRLDTIRYGSKLQKRSEQEQHMVDELKSSIRRRPGGPSGADSDSEAMTSWTERRTETRRTLPVHSAAKSASMDHSDSIFASAAAEQRNTLSRRGEVRTGGRSMSVPDSDDEELRAKYRTEKRYFVSGLERTPSHDKQTKYTFSMAGSDGEPLSPRSAALANKPPASPGQASSRPSLPPRGTSSREVVSTLTRTQHTQGYGSKADDLDRSIQDLLSMSSPSPPNRTPAHEVMQEQRVQQQNNAAPARPKEEPVDLEEDVISLQPIGRGVLNLEPEGTGSKTPIHLFTTDNIATEGRFPTSTLSGRGDTMSRKTVREEMMTQQVLQQSSGRTGMVPVAASHSPVVTHARSSTNQMNLQPSSSTPITRRAAGGSVYEDTNSRGYYSPASSSDGARRSESSNFGEMLATMQQQLIEETSSQSRQTPNQNEAVRTGRTGTPVDIRLAQSASNSNSDWSRSERTTSRVARDWSQQSSGGGAQTMQSSMQTTQVSTTNWPSEVTSTMVRRSNGSETSPGYNGLGQVGNSRFEPQVGPLLQNGLNGSVTRIAVQHPANAEQMTAAMDNRNNQMKSVPDRNNNRQSANELLIPTSRDRADSRLNNMSSYPGGGYNGLMEALENKYGVEEVANGRPQVYRDNNRAPLGDQYQMMRMGDARGYSGASPADIGTLMDALEEKHGSSQMTLTSQHHVTNGYSHTVNGGSSTNQLSPQSSLIQQQNQSQNFSQPSRGSSQDGPARQLSDQYTNNSDSTPPVFTPNSADRLGPQFNGPLTGGPSTRYQQEEHVQYNKVTRGQPSSQGQLTIDTSIKTWDQPAWSPSSTGSGQSPAMPAAGGRSQARHNATSPSQTGTLGRDLLVDGNPEILPQTPRFVHDMSRLWYKPKITRDEAIALLKDKPAGAFIIRDSNTFEGSFGLAVKVSQLPPNVQAKGSDIVSVYNVTGDPQAELVRHFLIEPTAKGVKIKGCSNEPAFTSLAALVYQHSIMPMALPCKLLLPGASAAEGAYDTVDSSRTQTMNPSSVTELLNQGVACNVLFVNTVDMESLTGPQAVAKAITETLTLRSLPTSAIVHFKVSAQGITVTDNKRKLFFRRHYPVNTVTFCGLDPEGRGWQHTGDETDVPSNARLFGLIARKTGSGTENACHIFAEVDPNQPASAIVNFITKVMMVQGRTMKT